MAVLAASLLLGFGCSHAPGGPDPSTPLEAGLRQLGRLRAVPAPGPELIVARSPLHDTTRLPRLREIELPFGAIWGYSAVLILT